METIRPLRANDPLLGQIKNLYKDAFPRAERKPFAMLIAGQKKKKMELWIFEKEGILQAFAFVILGDTLNILDYLAVNSSLRGQNIGTQVINWLQKKYNEKPLVVEIESVKLSRDIFAKRRKDFYLRNGFLDCQQDIILFGVPMELLATKRPIHFEEYDQVLMTYLGPFARPYVLKA